MITTLQMNPDLLGSYIVVSILLSALIMALTVAPVGTARVVLVVLLTVPLAAACLARLRGEVLTLHVPSLLKLLACAGASTVGAGLLDILWSGKGPRSKPHNAVLFRVAFIWLFMLSSLLMFRGLRFSW